MRLLARLLIASFLFGLVGCGPSRDPSPPAAGAAVSGQWLLRAAPQRNDCPEIAAFLPFDLEPVRLEQVAEGLRVTQRGGEVRYAVVGEQAWSRAAEGSWGDCRVRGEARLELHRVASGRLVGTYEATYTTSGGAACDGLPPACSVVHHLVGAQP